MKEEPTKLQEENLTT